MLRTRGAPYHPQTHAKIVRLGRKPAIIITSIVKIKGISEAINNQTMLVDPPSIWVQSTTPTPKWPTSKGSSFLKAVFYVRDLLRLRARFL